MKGNWMRPGLLLRAIIIALIVSGIAPVCAQVGMQADIGFKGYYKQGRWVAVTAIVENRGSSFDGELVVLNEATNSPEDTYQRKVSLPANSRKRVNLYLPISDVKGQLTVELRSRWRTIVKKDVRLQNTFPEDELVVVVSDEKGALQFLNGKRSPKPASAQSSAPPFPGAPPNPQSGAGTISVIYTSDQMLPDRWIGWDGVDAIVLGRISPKLLKPDQQQAILDWVSAGGVLIVTGGVDWARLTDQFFDPLLPIVPEGATSTSLSELRAFGGPFSSDATAQVTVGRLRDDATAFMAGGVPIIARRDVGLGQCIFLAFDYAQDPVRGWGGAADMWQEILSWGIGASRSETAFQREQEQTGQGGMYQYQYQYGYPPNQNQVSGPIGAVSETPELEPPKFGLVAIFLVAYIVCLVPVPYVVLKKRRRQELAWVIMPAIIVAFSLGAYAIGYSMKGGNVFMNRITVIEAGAGQPQAVADSYTLLFSPRRTAYNVAMGDPTAFSQEVWNGSEAPRGIGGLNVDQTDNMTLRDLKMDMWASKVFRIRSMADLGRGIDADVSVDQFGALHGTIRNGTGAMLQDANLIMPRSSANPGGTVFIGDIAPGETVDIDRTAKSGAAPNQGSVGALTYKSTESQSAEIRKMRENCYTALFGTGAAPRELTLVGWQFEQVPSVNVAGSHAAQRCVNMLVVTIPASRQLLASAPTSFESISSTIGAMRNAGTTSWGGGQSTASIQPGGEAEFNVAMPFISKTAAVNRGEISIAAVLSPPGGSVPVSATPNSPSVSAGTGAAVVAIDVYDIAAKRWITVAAKQNIQAGQAFRPVGLNITNIERLVDKQGNMRVRLRVLSTSTSSLDIDTTNVKVSLYRK